MLNFYNPLNEKYFFFFNLNILKKNLTIVNIFKYIAVQQLKSFFKVIINQSVVKFIYDFLNKFLNFFFI